MILAYCKSRIRSYERENAENYEPKEVKDDLAEQDSSADEKLEIKKIETSSSQSSFLAKLAIALGIAATITMLSVCLKPTGSIGPSLEVQRLAEGSSSFSMASSAGFSFKAFGYKFVLPEYPPGYASLLLSYL